MKKFIALLIIALTSFSLNAQVKPNKNKKVEIEVNGVCEMCKKRIEKAAYSVKGVKSAIWHEEDQDLLLIIDETKAKVIDVESAIAKIGHDTKNVKATDAQYAKIHGCCKYRSDKTH